MRYIVTKNNKRFAFSLIAVGLISMALGFITDTQRTWASLLLGNFYIMGIALCGTAFLAMQYVAEVGWSVQIKRVLMAFGTYLWIPGIAMLLIFILGGHHLYHWTHKELYDHASEEYDKILDGKSGWLNTPFYVTRIVIYFVIWYGLSMMIRKESKMEDLDGDIKRHKKMIRLSATFLVLFLVTSSTSAWDFTMSIEPHWFSTLWGWYTFAGWFVSGLAVITFITAYLKKNGYLEHVNENHLHDLGKFMFAFSIFWTYLWFAQFMLIWYANIPEEITHFINAFAHYKGLFIANFCINFFVPFLVLMSRDSKRKLNLLMVVASIIFIGHWIDVFLMIMPGTVGPNWHIGITEIGITLGFLGAFILVVTKSMAEIPLVPQKHPMLGESTHHHI